MSVSRSMLYCSFRQLRKEFPTLRMWPLIAIDGFIKWVGLMGLPNHGLAPVNDNEPPR